MKISDWSDTNWTSLPSRTDYPDTLVPLVKYIEDIQIFVEYDFYFTEWSGKYLYFMSGEATNEIYIFFTSWVK